MRQAAWHTRDSSGQDARGWETSVETDAVFAHLKSLLFNIILKICTAWELTRITSTKQREEKDSRQQVQAGAAQGQGFSELTLCIQVLMGVTKRVQLKDTLSWALENVKRNWITTN